MPYFDYEKTLLSYFQNLRMELLSKPLFLGGVSASGGGEGGPVGGFIGTLPQTRVSYDLSEIASSGTAISGSLLDNLNHIRARLNTLETNTSGLVGTGQITIQEDGTEIGAITVMNFVGANVNLDSSDTVTINIPHKLDYIRVWDYSAAVMLYYDATTAGLTSAVNNADNFDIIYLPQKTLYDVALSIGKDIVIVGAEADGYPGSRLYGNGTDPVITLTAFANVHIKNLGIIYQSGGASTTLIGIKNDGTITEIDLTNVFISVWNTDSGPGYCLYNTTSNFKLHCNRVDMVRITEGATQNNPFNTDQLFDGEIRVGYPTSAVRYSWIKNIKLGGATDYIFITSVGALTLNGAATVFDDLRVDAMSTRVGVTAPTDETGFRGDSNFYARNFVHTQADEVQFTVQMPHTWKLGSTLYPHVHFSPWITTSGDSAAQLIMQYYWANIDEQYPASPSTVTLTKTWTGDKQWYGLIAGNASGISATGKTLSSVLKCRLYRDNTVANNLLGKITLLSIDFHYEIDSLGSNTEYTK